MFWNYSCSLPKTVDGEKSGEKSSNKEGFENLSANISGMDGRMDEIENV